MHVNDSLYEANIEYGREIIMASLPTNCETESGILVQLIDQHAPEFASFIRIAVDAHIRLLSLLGPDHRDHNVIETVFNLAGLQNLKGKLVWLTGPFLRGVARKKGNDGRWRKKRIETWRNFRHLYLKADEQAELNKLYLDYKSSMEESLGLARGSAGNDVAIGKHVTEVAHKKTVAGGGMPWCVNITVSKTLQRQRFALLFLNDLTIIAGNSTPYANQHVPHDLSLKESFDMIPNS